MRTANASGPGLKPLVEGALLAAITVVLALVGFYVPFIGPLAVFLWPVPVALTQLRHGFKVSVLTVIVAGLILASFVGPLQALSMVVSFGPMGIAFGYAFAHKTSPTWTLLVGTLAFLLSLAVTFAISFVVLKVNGSELLGTLKEGMDQALAFYEKVLPPEQIAAMRATMQQLVELIKLAFPALIAGSSVTNAYVNYYVAYLIMRRLGYEVEFLPPFRRWRFPPWLAFGYLVAMLLIISRDYHHSYLLYQAGVNLEWFFMGAFYLEGLAVAVYMLARYKVSRFLQFYLIGLSLLPVVSALVTLVGLLDVLFDYRRLQQELS